MNRSEVLTEIQAHAADMTAAFTLSLLIDLWKRGDLRLTDREREQIEDLLKNAEERRIVRKGGKE